jgi:hypothetical protein
MVSLGLVVHSSPNGLIDMNDLSSVEKGHNKGQGGKALLAHIYVVLRGK